MQMLGLPSAPVKELEIEDDSGDTVGLCVVSLVSNFHPEIQSIALCVMIFA